MEHRVDLLQASLADVERFMSYVVVLPCGCWLWMGARSRGRGRPWYGSFRLGKQAVRAHRFSSEVLGKNPCPPGHDRDHNCELSLCVNPDHIEVVSKTENQRRKTERRASRELSALKRALDLYNAESV